MALHSITYIIVTADHVYAKSADLVHSKKVQVKEHIIVDVSVHYDQ